VGKDYGRVIELSPNSVEGHPTGAPKASTTSGALRKAGGPNAAKLDPKPSTARQNKAKRANKIDFLGRP